MASSVPIYRLYDLPWSTGREQEERFQRLLWGCVAALLALSAAASLLPVPEGDPSGIEEVPRRFARLVVETPPAPPPVEREQREEPAPVEPAPAPEPEPEQVAEPEPAPEPASEPEPAPEPVDRSQRARERASRAGVLPFASELASLRDNETVDSLSRSQTAAAGGGEAEAPTAERSLVTSRVGASSGGIDTSSLSRDTGGSGLAARSTTRVENPVASVGPAGEPAARIGSREPPARSREEIERVFDRNKGAIYALYNRALRRDPTLQGKLVLRLTIEPDGSVSSCEVVSSELGDPELEDKLARRVRLFQFEAKDVAPITTTKPIDFFPA